MLSFSFFSSSRRGEDDYCNIHSVLCRDFCCLSLFSCLPLEIFGPPPLYVYCASASPYSLHALSSYESKEGQLNNVAGLLCVYVHTQKKHMYKCDRKNVLGSNRISLIRNSVNVRYTRMAHVFKTYLILSTPVLSI